MKIALNTTIASKDRTGTGNYAAYLATAIMRADHGHHLTVYCRQDLCDWLPEQQNGHAVDFVRINSTTAPGRILWEQSRLPRDLNERKVDLLHSMAFTAPLRNRVPAVVTVHDLVFRRYRETIPLTKRAYYALAFKQSIKNAAMIITPSEAVRQSVLEDFRITPDRIAVIPEGVDPAFFEPVSPSRMSATCDKFGIRRPYFLTVSTLEPRKNLPMLIRAFQRLRESTDVKHQLIIVGRKGWRSGGLNEIEPDPNVIFTGYVSDPELRHLYAGAELFLWPSVYEGFGLPLLEAMASGTAIVASDIAVNREVCGPAAHYVPTKDVDAWQDEMATICDHKTLKDDLISKGKARAEAYSWGKAAELTLEVYEKAVRDGKN